MSDVATTDFDPKYDLLDPALSPYPFALYAKMQSEDPVYWSVPLNTWLVTRYDDCVAVLTEPRFSASRNRKHLSRFGADAEAASIFYEFSDTAIMFTDPPEQREQRAHAQCGFTMAALRIYRDHVEQLVAEMMSERVLSKKVVDFQQEYAEWLPKRLAARVFGIPFEDSLTLTEYVRDCFAFFRRQNRGYAPPRTAQEIEGSVNGLVQYFLDLVVEHRRKPKPDTLVGFMLDAMPAKRATDRQLAHQLALCAIAAHGPTSPGLISASVLTLLEHRREHERLLADDSLLANATDELIRHNAPVQYSHRVAASDIELRGAHIKEGDFVSPVLAAANRDPEIFADPHRLDVGRANAKRHLTFGAGGHSCLGADLPRTELRVTLGALLRHAPRARLGGTPEWDSSSPNFRTIKSLPLALS